VNLFLHPILLFGLGPASGLLVGILLTRRLIRRGHQDQGFLAGLLVMAALFGVQQLAIGLADRASFADTGPCQPLCGEWSWVPYMINWSTWGVGGVIYFFISVVTRSSPSVERPSAPLWTRKHVARLLAGVAVLGLLMLGTNEAVRLSQRAVLSESTQQSRHTISGVPAFEVGKYRLPSGGFGLDFAYAADLEFSSDGHWMAVHHSDGLDVWRLSDVKFVYSLREPISSWDRWVQFSPDGSLLAIIGTWEAEVLEFTSEGVSTAWRGENPAYIVFKPSFSPDGQQIFLMGFDDMLIKLDSRTGRILATIQLSLGLDVPLGPEDPKTVEKYLKDGPLPLWLPDTVSRILVEDLIRQAEQGRYTFSPDWRLAVIAVDKGLTVWDMAVAEPIGSFSVDAVVTTVSFTPDGRLLAVGTADGYLRFFTDEVQG
jgi:WD40 repeat protein